MMRQERHDDRVCTCHGLSVLHNYTAGGLRWHSATIETLEENREYAYAVTGSARYADAIVGLLAG